MNTDVITPNNIYAYIFSALNDDSSFGLLKDRYPDILADLVSAKSNANCSCRGRVVSYIIEKYKISDEKIFLDQIFSNEKTQAAAIKMLEDQKQSTLHSLSGKIITLVKKDNYWKEFYDSNRGNWRAFSIVDKGDSVDVYFL
jgi:hypothetical protein